MSFWLFFIGFNVTFFPMHILGLRDARRVYTYPGDGWGAAEPAGHGRGGVPDRGCRCLISLVNVIRSLPSGALAGANPWDADSLGSGRSPSPPPDYRASLHIPVVSSGHPPLWGRIPERAGGDRAWATHRRELLVTTVLEARPDHRAPTPAPTIVPFLMAVGVGAGLAASVFTPWGGPIAVVAALPLGLAWLWPNDRIIEPEERVA